MPKPAKKPRASALDIGTSIRRLRGDVEVVDRADPDAPNRTVRGARVRVHYLSMSLTDPQREAADRLAVQAEAADGAEWRPDGERVKRPLYQLGHPTERQVAAAGDLRRAREAVGNAAWGLLKSVVVDNVPLDKLAADGTENRHILRGRVLAGLDRLVEVWGME